MKNPGRARAFYCGGEGGIRTLDTLLTYTRFPGVLLQPLGHLTRFNCHVILDGLSSVSYTRLRARYRPVGRCLRQGSGSTTRTPHQIEIFTTFILSASRTLVCLHAFGYSLSPYRTSLVKHRYNCHESLFSRARTLHKSPCKSNHAGQRLK